MHMFAAVERHITSITRIGTPASPEGCGTKEYMYTVVSSALSIATRVELYLQLVPHVRLASPASSSEGPQSTAIRATLVIQTSPRTDSLFCPQGKVHSPCRRVLLNPAHRRYTTATLSSPLPTSPIPLLPCTSSPPDPCRAIRTRTTSLPGTPRRYNRQRYLRVTGRTTRPSRLDTGLTTTTIPDSIGRPSRRRPL